MAYIDQNKKVVGHRLRGVPIEKNKIRLLYVALEKLKEEGSEAKLSKTYCVSSPYMIPYGMTIEQACKVISYLSEKVESEQDIEPATQQSVFAVIKLLDEYGFRKLEGFSNGYAHTVTKYNPAEKIAGIPKSPVFGVVDLFTVGGHMKRFEKSDMSSRFFDWFTPGVEKAEIDMIYASIQEVENGKE
ncbi:MAG: hypothetical protein J6A28_00175 [Clostridia bacterium]|nr:hypothetical protein [Clostridia bacterium]